MCSICGCSHGESRVAGKAVGTSQVFDHGMAGPHAHGHDRHHHHHHEIDHSRGENARDSTRIIEIEKNILAKNQMFADENRARWSSMRLLVLNLVSSPGAGKTSLLVKTLEALHDQMPICVIEGDQETSNDAERIRQTGVPAIQINTGRGCHLDAHLVGHAAETLPLAQNGILFIENIGNLVCPSGFDLGETKRVVILSVTEGDDKPIKYPDAFASADIMVVSKFDLLPHVDFDAAAASTYARSINPGIKIINSSTRTSPGIGDWLDWLLHERLRILETASRQPNEPPAETNGPNLLTDLEPRNA
jgi:hydrogenase nickel incorporation protein HypB